MNTIEKLYEIESHGRLAEFENTKLTLRCSVYSVALFNAIADRFCVTRFDLLQQNLDSIAEHFFSSLGDDDQRIIAEIADKEATDLLLKNGATSFHSMGGEQIEGTCHWRNRMSILGKV
ncbi:hypothetical protein [Achromobacter aegrifaciens]|uniref:hypothetical protein n=1 Tax=Achromobacter aegrifaciens TaxID=1287736 RepID=UPI002868D605|nr:hypothetical protein [Achromobacter aegrifaciens]